MYLVFLCKVVTIINLTSFPLNDHDGKIMKQSMQKCPALYKNSPCLRKFIKIGERDYHVICGHEEKEIIVPQSS